MTSQFPAEINEFAGYCQLPAAGDAGQRHQSANGLWRLSRRACGIRYPDPAEHPGQRAGCGRRGDAGVLRWLAAFQQVAEACRVGREPRWLTDALLATLTEPHG